MGGRSPWPSGFHRRYDLAHAHPPERKPRPGPHETTTPVTPPSSPVLTALLGEFFGKSSEKFDHRSFTFPFVIQNLVRCLFSPRDSIIDNVHLGIVQLQHHTPVRFGVPFNVRIFHIRIIRLFCFDAFAKAVGKFPPHRVTLSSGRFACSHERS